MSQVLDRGRKYFENTVLKFGNDRISLLVSWWKLMLKVHTSLRHPLSYIMVHGIKDTCVLYDFFERVFSTFLYLSSLHLHVLYCYFLITEKEDILKKCQNVHLRLLKEIRTLYVLLN